MVRVIRAIALTLLLWGMSPGPAGAQTPLPFALGGAFALTDQYGNARDQTDPDGRAQLLYFGYANCPGICTTAMPAMARVTDLLAARGLAIRPLMITVDPDRDRVGTMTAPLRALHPDFIGLTGSEAALTRAYTAFSVEKSLQFIDPERGAIYAHGSVIYLLDAQGEVLTLLPPTLDADRIAEIAAGYLID